MTANVLATELQLLVSESKRKYSDLRNAAEKSLQDLKALPNTSEAQIAADLSRRPHFINPFLAACKSKNAKLILPGITSLQRLITSRGLSGERLQDVLEAFQDCSGTGLDVQLKILQSLPPLLQFYGSSLGGQLPATVFHLCSTLQQNKTAAVSSTAAATFQQTAAFLFERLEGDQSRSPQEKFEIIEDDTKLTVSAFAYDAYRVFEDICFLTEGERPKYMQKSIIAQPFGLELVETLLTNHTDTFESHPEMQLLLKSRVVPLVTRFLSERLSYAVTVRTVRILCILLREFFAGLEEDLEIPLSLLNHMLDADGTQSWRRVLCMETFRVIYSSGDLAADIYAAFDQKDQKRSIIQENLANFVRIASEKPAVIGIGQQSSFPSTQASNKAQAQEQALMEAGDAAGIIASDYGVAEVNVPGISTQYSTMRNPCLDQLDKADPPAIPETYVYSLVLSCIGNLSDSLARVVLPATMQNAKDRHSHDAPANRSEQDANGESLAQQQRPRGRSEPINPQDLSNTSIMSKLNVIGALVNSCWPAVLATSSTFLYAALDADFYRTLIRSVQKFTQVAGLLRLATPRDAFMTTLAKAAIPASLLKSDLLSPASAGGMHSPRRPSGSQSTSDALFSQALESPNRSRRPSLDMSAPMLSQRNLMCLRALINLAIALGPILEKGWPIVLDSLQKANMVLATSGTLATARDYRLGSQVPEGQVEPGFAQTSLGTEIAAVEAATTRMLASTNDYTNAAFTIFLDAVCGLVLQPVDPSPIEEKSSESRSPARPIRRASGLSTASVPSPQYTQSAISKIGEVARVNLVRIAHEPEEAGWELLINTLLSISTSRVADTTARFMAADVLGSIAVEAAVGAIDEEPETMRHSIQERSLQILAQQIALLDQKSNQEPRTLVPADADVQRSSLEALRAILDRCGDTLSVGWPLIFTVIGSAFTSKKDPKTIHEGDETAVSISQVDIQVVPKLARSAFGSVQLICSDFLASVPKDCMPSLVDLVSRFCSQRNDLNISLTAVGLGWNISDYLRGLIGDFDLPQDADVRPEGELDTYFRSLAESGSMTAMWLTLQRRLVPIAADPRADVRNGAIRTLFRIIDACGGSMKATVWTTCLNSIVLGIGERNCATQATVRSTVEDPQHPDIKALEGTTQIILEDLAHVFESDISTISQLKTFDQIWSRICALHSSYIDLRSPTLTTISWNAMSKILTAADEGPKLSDTIARFTFDLWSGQEDSILINADASSLDKSLVAYVSALEPLLSLLRPQMKDADVETVCHIVSRCVESAPRPPYVSDLDVMTPLQIKALKLFESLDRSTATAPVTLITSLSSLVVLPYIRPKAPTSTDTLTCIAMSKGAIAAMQDIITRHCKGENLYRQGAIAKALQALAESIENKYKWKKQGKTPSMWRAATIASLAILKEIGKAVPNLELGADILDPVVMQVIRISTAIGYADLSELPANNDEVLEDEQFDLDAQQQILQTLVPVLSQQSVDETQRTQLVQQLFRNSIIHQSDYTLSTSALADLYKLRYGRTFDPPFTPRLNVAYYHLDTLFQLASSANPSTGALAKAALPFLILRCALPLKTYIADQPLRGRMPTPTSQRLELLYMLDKLRQLETDASDVPAPNAAHEAAGGAVRVADASRRHLAWLAPLVHKASGCARRDEELSAALTHVLDVVIGVGSPL